MHEQSHEKPYAHKSRLDEYVHLPTFEGSETSFGFFRVSIGKSWTFEVQKPLRTFQAIRDRVWRTLKLTENVHIKILVSNAYITTLISEYLYQNFYFRIFTSDWLYQNIHIGSFVSECLCQDSQIRILISELPDTYSKQGTLVTGFPWLSYGNKAISAIQLGLGDYGPTSGQVG